MGRAKCKLCGKSLNTKESFSENGKAPWFCNESEYKIYMQPKWDKDEFKEDISETIPFMWGLDNSGWLAVKKALVSWYDDLGNEVVRAYLEDKGEEIEDSVRKKSFDTSVNKAHYIMAIIANTIRDFAKDYTPKEELTQVREVDFYMPDKVCYTPTKKHTAFAILEEGGD